jgi:preprotein translocase subunit SecD
MLRGKKRNMSKLKQMTRNWRVILLVVCLVFAIVAIHPNPWAEGVAIRAVEPNSSAMLAGIKSPLATDTPMSRERIVSINNVPVSSVADFFNLTSGLKPNVSVYITTNKNTYVLKTKPLIVTEYLDEYENQTVVEANDTKIISVQKTKSEIIGTESLGLTVYEAPTTNIKRGLDLQGGSRVLLKPEKKISEDDMLVVLDNMKERLNVYGITDVLVMKAGDLSGNQFFIVEIAGAAESEATELVSKQGKFEAKVGNITIFSGGNDIKYVCMSAECSGIDPMRACGQSGSAWFCNFRFSISLSPEAAQKQADATKDLSVTTSENGEDYLTEKLYLFLDDVLVDELNIGADLKGRAVTDIQISGSGQGENQQEAMANTLENMKRLQTIIATGSLPVKLEIVKTDTISPALGEEFTKNSIFIGLIAMLVVGAIISVRYRKLSISIPMILTPVFEVTMIVGIAALIGWNLDLASIAAIIIVIGTGVDHCLIITDEILSGERQEQIYDWKKKMKNAFFIILASYSTLFVAMLPLMFAGAGLLKGFALTTILGASVGVFIARPAFAEIIEIMLKD